MDAKIVISPLADDNYPTWAARIRALFVLKKCKSAILKPPVLPDEIEISETALALILMNVNDRWAQKIIKCANAHAAWVLLEKEHTQALAPMASSIHAELFRLRMSAGQTVDAYIDSIELLQDKLDRLGKGIEDSVLVAQVLGTLKPGLFSDAAYLRARPPATLDLLRIELRALDVSQAPEQQHAHAARTDGRRGRPKPGDNKGSDDGCHHCGQSGHRKFMCYYWRLDNPAVNAPAASTGAAQGAGHFKTAGPAAPRSGAIPTASDAHCMMAGTASRSGWMVDSGASAHMCGVRAAFTSLTTLSKPATVWLADGSTDVAFESGDVLLHGTHGSVCLKDVLYLPSFSTNLFSLSAAMAMGHTSHATARTVTISSLDGTPRLTGTMHGSSWWLDLEHTHVAAAARTRSPQMEQALDWHRRTAHTSFGVLAHMQRLGELPESDLDPSIFLQARSEAPCDSCLAGKLTRSPHPPASTPAPYPMYRVHVDLQGPFRHPAPCGAVYALAAVDALTGYAEVALLRAKGDATSALIPILNRMATQSDTKIKAVRSDQGGEFCNAVFAGYCAAKGIVHELTAAGTSCQNGVAERYNRTLLDRVRTLLHAARLPPRLWGPALLHANSVLNSVCRATATQPPITAAYGVPSNLLQFHEFGSVVWVYNTDPAGKLGPRGVRGLYLGNDGPLSSGRYCVLIDGRVYDSCDVRFLDRMAVGEGGPEAEPFADGLLADEPAAPALAPAPPPLPSVHPASGVFDSEPSDAAPAPAPPALVGRRLRRSVSFAGLPPPSTLEAPSPASPRHGPPCLPAACAQPPPSPWVEPSAPPPDSPGPPPHAVAAADDILSDDESLLASPAPLLAPALPAVQHSYNTRAAAARNATPTAAVARVAVCTAPPGEVPPTYPPAPLSVAQALASPDAASWQQAMAAELAAMAANECWRMVPLPPGAHAIGSRFVFARKRDGRFKARLVAKGYSQRPGVDFDVTYAPVSAQATLRLFVATVALNNLEWGQLDFTSAFLNGRLDRTVYMRPPPGCELGPPGHVCLLQRSIYGLCQAGHHWDAALRAALEEAGFVSSDADPCLYVRVLPCGGRILVLVYVDDALVAARTVALLREWMAVVMSTFAARDLGVPDDFLNICFERDRSAGTIRMHQRPYIQRLAETFPACRAVRAPLTPLPPRSFSEHGAPLTADQLAEYPSLVGALNYLACCTRPDIAQAVSVLSQFLKCPAHDHYSAAMRALAYAVNTCDLSLVFRAGPASARLVGFSDADFAGDPTTRRSRTGTAVLLAGAAVSWASKLQATVALSTTEAEYQAISASARDVLWARKLLPDLGGGRFGDGGTDDPFSGPVTIYTDSETALALVRNPMTTQRSKHIDVVHHFARERVATGQLVFAYVRSANNAADCLTKPLPPDRLAACRSGLGLA